MITDLPIEQLKIWQENDMEHLRYEYDLKPDDVVLDLGAYNGEFAQKIHDKYGCEVIAVEPTSAIMGLGNKPWLTVINKAAGTLASGDMIAFGGSAYWTSHFAEEINQSYPAFPLLSILNRDIALLKINVEGMEYGLLDDIIRNGCINSINNIQVQFHQTEGYKESYFDIVKNLIHTHHKTWGVDWIWENWKRND
jgi:FkbM family methyltransferase